MSLFCQALHDNTKLYKGFTSQYQAVQRLYMTIQSGVEEKLGGTAPSYWAGIHLPCFAQAQGLVWWHLDIKVQCTKELRWVFKVYSG